MNSNLSIGSNSTLSIQFLKIKILNIYKTHSPPLYASSFNAEKCSLVLTIRSPAE